MVLSFEQSKELEELKQKHKVELLVIQDQNSDKEFQRQLDLMKEQYVIEKEKNFPWRLRK